MAFKRVRALWKNVSQHAVNDMNVSEDEEDEDDEYPRSGNSSPMRRSMKSPREF